MAWSGMLSAWVLPAYYFYYHKAFTHVSTFAADPSSANAKAIKTSYICPFLYFWQGYI